VPTVKVMSWNVESFGDAKAAVNGNPSSAIKLVATVIHIAKAELVGIMELKSGYGQWVAQEPVKELNNAPTGKQVWKSAVSTRQDGIPEEEYIYLWRTDTGTVRINEQGSPGPTSSIGVIDAHVLDSLKVKNGWTAVEVDALLKGLIDAGYATKGHYKKGRKLLPTKSVRVISEKWHDLDQGNLLAIDLSKTGAPKLTAQHQTDLAEKVHGVDILRFPGFGDRSPYLGNFLIGKTSVMFGLLHAPGPSELIRSHAINIMALSQVLTKASDLVLMGDFNIQEAAQKTLTAPVYERDPQKGFGIKVPRRYEPVFGPITGPPLNARNLIGLNKTSLRNVYASDDPTSNLAAVMANPYDKIFVAGKTVTAGAPMVENIVAAIVPGLPTYQVDLARQTLKFYREFRGTPALQSTRDSYVKDLTKRTTKLTRLQNGQTTAINKVAKAGGLGTLSPKSALYKRYMQVIGDVAKQQLLVDGLQREIDNLDAFAKLVVHATKDAPQGVGSAHAAFRFALTDHLPVSAQLTAP
jgi:hypothetical protein